ncbi:hypothetical protein ACFX13_034445 [Malus domestica]
MDLVALPEGCKATVASLTTPPDACRLSAVSRGFRSAADLDAVWDRFLPPDVYTILGKCSVQPQSPSSLPVPTCSSSSSSWKSKKELFLSLSIFSVDKWSGKKGYMISARKLKITWGDTPQYWEWIRLPESRSRFRVAEGFWDLPGPSVDPPLILSHSSSSSTFSSSKKKLYLTLCENPVLVDDGKMSFTLDKWSGKKCYMISPKDLMIAWGGTPAYWKWISLANSRFEEVAELVVVWWFEIRGKIDTRILSPSTIYKAYLVFMLSERARGFDRDDPLEVKVGLFGEEETSSKRIVFLGRQNITGRPMEIDETQYPKKRPDGWLEVEIGEFFCPGEEDGGLMEMTCMEVDRMKRGLIVQGIEVRPKRM